jgi:hypothetical protein
MIRRYQLGWLLRSAPLGWGEGEKNGVPARGPRGRRRRAWLLAACHGCRPLTAIIFGASSPSSNISGKRGDGTKRLACGEASGFSMGQRALGVGSFLGERDFGEGV